MGNLVVLTPQTKIESNTDYIIINELVGTINVSNVSNINIYGGKLRGYFNLTGSVSDVRFKNIEVFGTNIGYHVRSEGSNLLWESCITHDVNYAIWLRASSGGYNNNVSLIDCSFSRSANDLVYMYKVHGVTVSGGKYIDANMLWQPPTTSQKIASGDCFQLILCDCISIDGCFAHRGNTGNKFCFIISGSAGSQGTPLVEQNFIKINNNYMVGPIATSEGGAQVYIYDLHPSVTVDFTFNHVEGRLAGVKFNSLGTFYSNGNTYTNNSIGIERQKADAKVYSVSDIFLLCTRNVSNGVIIE